MWSQKQSKSKNFAHWKTRCIFAVEHPSGHVLIQDWFRVEVMEFFQELIHLLEIPEKTSIGLVRSISWRPNKLRIPMNTMLLVNKY